MQFGPTMTPPCSRTCVTIACSLALPSVPDSEKPAVRTMCAWDPFLRSRGRSCSITFGGTPQTTRSGTNGISLVPRTVRMSPSQVAFGCTAASGPMNPPSIKLRSTAPASESGRGDAPTTATDLGKRRGVRSRSTRGLYLPRRYVVTRARFSNRDLIRRIYRIMNDHELLQSAMKTAQDAGTLLLERLGRSKVEHKGVVDLVTEADKASE